MADPIDVLADRIAGGTAVGFVGAGASARSGYPVWGDLLSGISPDLEGEGLLRSGIAVSDALISALSSYELEGPSPLHELLARLPFHHFVTTNFDDLMEEACNDEARRRLGRELELSEKCMTLSVTSGHDFSRFKDALSAKGGERAVLHLLGSLRLGDTTRSLSTYRETDAPRNALREVGAIFANRTVVFVGSTLEDPDLMQVVEGSRTYDLRGPNAHFALLPDSYEPQIPVLRARYGIEAILYEVKAGPDGRADHTAVDEQLSDLVDIVEDNFPHVFISYSREDLPRAMDIARGLASAGRVWLDQHIEYGDKWQEVVEDHVTRCRAFVLVMTEHSRESDWVDKEIELAKEHGKPIFPILLEGEPWPEMEEYQFVDLRLPESLLDQVSELLTS